MRQRINMHGESVNSISLSLFAHKTTMASDIAKYRQICKIIHFVSKRKETPLRSPPNRTRNFGESLLRIPRTSH